MRVSEMKPKTRNPAAYDTIDWKNKRNRLTVLIKAGSCAGLLALLAVCGYMGASPQAVQTVAAPIAQRTVLEADVSTMTFEEAKAEYASQRERELALLDSVIDNSGASAENIQNALEQKTQIAQRMEQEAQIRAALTHMGYTETAAICGAQTVTLITPEKKAQSEADSARMIDAAASVSGISASDIKIILVKK